MTWGGMRSFWSVIVLTTTLGPASAQVTPLDIFGGLLGAAQAQAARDAWARLPNGDRSCLDRAMARRNTDIAAMIQRGIGPDDGRLGDRISDELPGTPVLTTSLAARAFIAVKWSERGAVYGSAADLAAWSEAMPPGSRAA